MNNSEMSILNTTTQNMTKYQRLMTDKNFDPFGSFTISQLNMDKKPNRNQINQVSSESYFEEVVQKTKDDSKSFDPKQFKIDTNGSIFSCNNIIQLQKQQSQAQGGQTDNDLFFLKYSKSMDVIQNDDKRQSYVYLLKVRSLLNQPCTFQQCLKAQRGEVYAFGAFEVYDMKDDRKDLVLFFDFLECRIHYLHKSMRVSLRFEQIKSAVAGFNEDEIYLSTIDFPDRKLRVKYKFQRDLVVEYFGLAVENRKGDVTDFKMKRSQLNLILDDNVVPPKQILSYKIQIQSKSGEKRIADFTLGMNQIVVHEIIDLEEMEEMSGQKKNQNMQILIDNTYKRQLLMTIHNIIPFNQRYFYVECNSEPNQLICRHDKEISSFFFESELEASNVKEALKAVYNHQIYNDQIYIHLPEMKRQEYSAAKVKAEKFLKEKSKQIGSQIATHKQIIQLLLSAKSLLDIQGGEKNDFDFSEGQGLNNTRDIEFDDDNAYDPDENQML